MTFPLSSLDVQKLFRGKFVCVIGDSGKYAVHIVHLSNEQRFDMLH